MSGRLRREILVVLVAFAAGCRAHAAPTQHRDVPLVWVEAQEAPVASSANLAPNRFKVTGFVDRRTTPRAEIGANVKRPEAPVPVTTKDDVAAWAHDRFVHVLRRQGFEIVPAGETVTLEVELMKLYVSEAGFFNGDVELVVVAKGANGKALWRGAVAGRSKRWGKTNNLDNYYEALTNAFEGAVRKIPQDPTFLAALPR